MKLTICACASRTFIKNERVARLAAAAQQAGMEVSLVSDLCELCQQRDASIPQIAQGTIAACHPRAVRSLMDWLGEQPVECIDLRTEEPLSLPGLPLDKVTDEQLAPWLAQLAAMAPKQGHDAWYPTLDKEACIECGKCLEFCPFGVYEMVEGRVRVMHPTHCKNNCPACARTCPATAIIFPKYTHSPINGGESREEATPSQAPQSLYHETLRQRLAQRREGIKLTKD